MLALAAAVLLALPHQGVLDPGRSLAGVRLGAQEAQVRRALGPRVGVCRGCPRRTLYFTYAPFNAVGVGVELARRRAVAIYTLWSPSGWQTRDGVQMGTDELTVTSTYPGMLRTHCSHYDALELRRGRVSTVFWLRNGNLWGFGLQRPSVSVCR